MFRLILLEEKTLQKFLSIETESNGLRKGKFQTLEQIKDEFAFVESNREQFNQFSQKEKRAAEGSLIKASKL